MGKKKSQPVAGKRSRPQTRSQYVYHWDRIIGVLVVASLLIGLAAYGIHSLSSPEDLEQIETADNVPTQTLNDEKQLAANIGGRIDPEYVPAEKVERQAQPESAEMPQTPQSEDNELPMAAVEGVVPATDSAADDGGSEQSTGSEKQEPSQSQHRDADTPKVAEKPQAVQPGGNDTLTQAVEDAVHATDIAVDDEGSEQSTESRDQEPSQSRHRVDTPEVFDVKDKKGIFTLVDTRLSSPAVKRFELAKSVKNKKPIGDINTITPNSRGVATVYAFSNVVGMRKHNIYYRWTLNDQQVAKVRVGIGADRWRSYSSKVINESMKGTWRVELQDREGQVLASADFVY